MKKKLRRAFTITELVIVIAVIAILAAVLIPTFVNVANKAKESADTSLAKNMNTILSTTIIGNETPENMDDVTYVLLQNGYKLENLNPTAQGNIFLWVKSENRIVYADADGSIIYSEGNKYQSVSELPADTWLTVKSASDITKWSEKTETGIGYYFASTISENLTFTKPCSIDTGSYRYNGTLTFDFAGTGEVELQGAFSNVVIDAPAAEVNNYSSIDSLTIGAVASSSYHEYGYVKQFTVAASAENANIVIEKTGFIETLTVNAGTLTNKGYVASLAGSGGTVSNDGGYIAQSTGYEITNDSSYVFTIASYSDLASFRDMVNNGNHFTGITVSLEANVSLSGRAWVPIGYDSRDNYAEKGYIYFGGTFKGNGHTISGLSNVGYVPTILRTDTYGYGSNKVSENNYVYGLFGIVSGATIENLALTAVDIQKDPDYTLDSVGALVGHIDGGADISNITVSGTIVGDDGVGGVVGRAYSNLAAGSVTISNCTVTGRVVFYESKGAGILGFASKKAYDLNITIENCTVSGSIESLGTKDNNSREIYNAGIMTAAAALTCEIKECTVEADQKWVSDLGPSVRKYIVAMSKGYANKYLTISGVEYCLGEGNNNDQHNTDVTKLVTAD